MEYVGPILCLLMIMALAFIKLVKMTNSGPTLTKVAVNGIWRLLR